MYSKNFTPPTAKFTDYFDTYLGGFTAGATVSIQLEAAPVYPISTVSYSLQSGSLPTGLSLSSTGLLSGTLGAITNSSIITFTIRAQDSIGGYKDRIFNFTHRSSSTPQKLFEIDVNNTSSVATATSQTILNSGVYTTVDSSFTRGNDTTADINTDIMIVPECVLLMQFDGNFTDTSTVPKTFSSVGTISTTTGQKKFGTASLNCNGVGGLNMPNNTALASHLNLAANDFTVECWVRIPTNTGVSQVILSAYNGNGQDWQIGTYNGTGQLYFFGNASNIYIASNFTLAFDTTFHHIAACRTGAYLTIYLDGKVAGSFDVGATAYFGNTYSYFDIGNQQGAYFVAGQIDALRIINGQALYVGPFTVPTVAPNVPTPSKNFFMPPSNNVSSNTFLRRALSSYNPLFEMMNKRNVDYTIEVLYRTPTNTPGRYQAMFNNITYFNGGTGYAGTSFGGGSTQDTCPDWQFYNTNGTVTYAYGDTAMPFCHTTTMACSINLKGNSATSFLFNDRNYNQVSGSNTFQAVAVYSDNDTRNNRVYIGTDDFSTPSAIYDSTRLYAIRIWDRAMTLAQLQSQHDTNMASFSTTPWHLNPPTFTVTALNSATVVRNTAMTTTTFTAAVNNGNTSSTITWSLSKAQASWINISAGGVVSGTAPNVAATYYFTVIATDSYGAKSYLPLVITAT
jgi:hypothetical protein